MRLAFLGSPSASVPSLEALVRAGHEITTVITRPDRRRGRGGSTAATPVKVAAQQLGVTVSHSLDDVFRGNPQFGVVVAFGAIIPTSTLERLAMFNVHFSLLPRWRGAAPVERAILAGDDTTGVCVMGVEPSLDTGPVYARAVTTVDDKTAAALTSELASLGAALLVATLGREPLATPTLQVGEPTYAKKLSANDYLLDSAEPVQQLARIVRLGRAVTWIGGRRVLVHAATPNTQVHGEPGTVRASRDAVYLMCTDGGLSLHTVQPDGGRIMDATSWWVGARLKSPGVLWGSDAAPPL